MANESLRQLSDTLNMATAQLSGDPQRMQMALGMQQSRKLQEEAAARQQKLQQFAQVNPSLSKMYELFGEKGLQQGYLQQQEGQQAELERVKKIKTYVDAGLSQQDATLLASGLDAKAIIDLKESGKSQAENIISNVDKSVENTVEEVGFVEPFAQMEEAFGLADATQEGFNIVARKLGFEPADVTGQAVRARDNLNLEIKTTLAQDFTGRVNQQLLQQIDELLPKSSLTSEKDAQAKYSLMRDRARNRIQRLEQGIKSGTLSETQIATARDVLYRTKLLEKKIDAAVLSLELETTDLDPKKTNLDSTVILDTNETQRFKDLYRPG